jgi:regulator of ribonuclease activity A
MIIVGAVRDTRAGRCRSGDQGPGKRTSRRGAARGTGEIDVPVTFGGTTFVPGQYLWREDDGIVVTRPGYDDAPPPHLSRPGVPGA